jgi:Icc-related predicted phosphoesterase
MFLSLTDQPIRKDQTELNLGCPILGERIKEINPRLHICGHIHSSQGILDISEPTTTYINAASLGEDYQYSNKRKYLEWEITRNRERRPYGLVTRYRNGSNTRRG